MQSSYIKSSEYRPAKVNFYQLDMIDIMIACFQAIRFDYRNTEISLQVNAYKICKRYMFQLFYTLENSEEV